MAPARCETPMKSATGIRYEKCGSDCMTLRIGQSARSKGGHLAATTPSATSDGSRDRCGNQDDGERRHRERPLAEEGEVNDAAAGEQRQPPPLQPPAEDRGEARDHHPRDRRNADGPEAVCEQAMHDVERPFDPEGDGPRRVFHREDAEDLVLVEDVDDDVDPVDEGEPRSTSARRCRPPAGQA